MLLVRRYSVFPRMKAVLAEVLLIGEVGFQDRLRGLDQVPARSGIVR